MDKQEEAPENKELDGRTGARVTAMLVNPYLIHVYWQLPQREVAPVVHTLLGSESDGRPILRFYDVTCIVFDGTNAHQIFDMEVDLRTMTWNVPIWSPDKSYVIDLGYKTIDGRFHQIARSNVVNVPRAEPSMQVAERYLRVERGQIKSLVPMKVPVAPPRETVKAARLETAPGTGKETWAPFEGIPIRASERDVAESKHRPEDSSLIPGRLPEVATGGEQPVDLVHLTQEKFSLGVSSMVVAHGKDS
jgi:hypothetical protein